MKLEKNEITKKVVKIGANTFEAVCYMVKIDINAIFDVTLANLSSIQNRKLKTGEQCLKDYTKLNKQKRS